MFCLYTLPLARPAQAKVQMLITSSCTVKSIPWNLVNLSHLYLLFSLMTILDFNCIPRDPFFKSGGTDPDVSRIKLVIKGGIISEGIFNFVLTFLYFSHVWLLNLDVWIKKSKGTWYLLVQNTLGGIQHGPYYQILTNYPPYQPKFLKVDQS